MMMMSVGPEEGPRGSTADGGLAASAATAAGAGHHPSLRGVSRRACQTESLRCQRPLDAMKYFAKSFPESGGHDVVEDGIDGRVDVEHDAAEI